MFIFRNRRTNLVRKIWRESVNDEQSAEVKSQLSSVLKRLREPVLEELLHVLHNRGQYTGACCNIPNGRLGRHNVTPLLLLCRLWRWPDVVDESELVRLPVCQQQQDGSGQPQLQTKDGPGHSAGQLECCNPYHWARSAIPELCLCPSKGQPTCDIYSQDVPYSGCLVSLDYSNCDSPHGGGRGEPTVADRADRVGGGGGLGRTPVWSRYGDGDDVHSVATGGTTCHDGGLNWCTLAYWEEQTRVGRLFPVTAPTVEIFTKLPGPKRRQQQQRLQGGARSTSHNNSSTNTTTPASSTSSFPCFSGVAESRRGSSEGGGGVSADSVESQYMCVRTIAERDNPRPNESVRKAREKIGLGVMLNLCGTTLSVYNQSEVPVFVNSPTLDQHLPSSTSTNNNPASKHFSVYKILPGYSMKVFDFVTSQNLQRLANNVGGTSRLHGRDGPFDPNAVRLSFGKGWGGKYSRQIITSCPCWLEILLVPPR